MNILNIRTIASAMIVGAAALTVACSDSPTEQAPGTLQLFLTDAPFPFDEVQSVDVFVLRVEGRVSEGSAAEAEANTDEAAAPGAGWMTLAEPNAELDLLTLQNGVTANLGQASLAPGTYRGFRLVIDPSKSSITLKDGTVLDAASTPNVSFPSAGTSGIKIVLTSPVVIGSGETTSLLIDFDVAQSFIMRSNSLAQDGLLFTPVIKATVHEVDE